MRTQLAFLLTILVAGCGQKDATLENCIACAKEVSVNAEVCPHCGEPNPTEALRTKIAEAKKRKAEELASAAAREEETQDRLSDAEVLGADLLTEDGRTVLLLDEEEREWAMRALLDKGQDPFTAAGKELLSEHKAAQAKYTKVLQTVLGNDYKHWERYPDLIPQDVFDGLSNEDLNRLEPHKKAIAEIESRIEAARVKVRAERMKPEVVKAINRLRREIEKYVKQNGKLPDQDTAAHMAFADEMRDPWSLAMRFRIVDAATGKYVITSAGPDLSDGTVDDPRLECQVGK